MKTITARYNLRGAGKRLLTERASEVVLSGPAGTGKSYACLAKLHLMMMMTPGSRGLIVRKTAVSLTSTALVTFRTQVAEAAIATGQVTWYGGSSQEAAQYRYANGSTITVGGMDRATRVMSADYDVIYVQEATELVLNDWEMLSTRLRNGAISFQQLMADCNPDTPTHWLKERSEAGASLMLESAHRDNPALYRSDGTTTERGASYMEKLDALTGVRRHRLRDGLWVAAEGVIYADWQPSVHMLDRFEIPATWSRWWAIDWGFTNPFVLQRWAEDPDGRLYLYAEIYRTGRTVDEHAKAVMAEVTNSRGQWIEPKPQRIICDHDSGDRATFTKFTGLGTQAANKTVDHGIQAFQRRLRVAADGKPRLFVLRDCVHDRDTDLAEAHKPTSTAEEIPGYVWKDGTKEEPVKENDHGCDAGRYLVADRDLQGDYKVRWL